MSDKGIVIPTWAIPLVVSLFVGAISYGAAQANAETTTKDSNVVFVLLPLLKNSKNLFLAASIWPFRSFI